MLGEGEFFALLETYTALKMRYHYSQAELDNLVPYHYQLTVMMVEKLLKEEQEERQRRRGNVAF